MCLEHNQIRNVLHLLPLCWDTGSQKSESRGSFNKDEHSHENALTFKNAQKHFANELSQRLTTSLGDVLHDKQKSDADHETQDISAGPMIL